MTVARARTLVALAGASAITVAGTGCGASTTQHPVPFALINTDSVWVPGQASLLSGWQEYAVVRDDPLMTPLDADTDAPAMLALYGATGLTAYRAGPAIGDATRRTD